MEELELAGLPLGGREQVMDLGLASQRTGEL